MVSRWASTAASRFGVGRDLQRDAVGHVEVLRFALVLDAVDELAGVAFLHEGGGQLGLEGDDERAAGGDGEAGLGRALDEDVGGFEDDGLAIEFERDLAAIEERRDLRGGEGGDGGDGFFMRPPSLEPRVL
jgi:hypothetical protein